jgi:hypothetical protein
VPDRLEIRLDVGEDGDAEELAAAASNLRRELLELPVADVSRVSAGPAPPGTRSAEMLEAGALMVALAQTPSLVSAVGSAVSSWISSRHGRSATMQLGEDRIELNGITRDDQERLLKLFERARGGGRA